MEKMKYEYEYTKIEAFCEDKPSCVPINVLNMPHEVVEHHNKPHGVVKCPENGLLIVRSEITQEMFLALLLQIVHSLPFLEVLEIQTCANVTEIPALLFTGLPNLSALFLTRCPNLNPLPKNLGQITSNLKTLLITGCPRAIRLPKSTGMLPDLNSHMNMWSTARREDAEFKMQLWKLKEEYPINVKVAFMTLLCSDRYFVKVGDSLVHVPPEIWKEIFSYFEIF